jgi:transcriptional regulator with XRE-family HTH domain
MEGGPVAAEEPQEEAVEDETEDGHAEEDPGPLARQYLYLIREMWPTDQPEPRTKSDRAVAAAINAALGTDYSYSLMWQIRKGKVKNTRRDVLLALSQFFKVPFGYFGTGEEAEAIQEQLDALALVRDAGFNRASLRRMGDMSPEGRQSVAAMIETVARMELERRKDRDDAGDQEKGGD